MAGLGHLRLMSPSGASWVTRGHRHLEKALGKHQMGVGRGIREGEGGSSPAPSQPRALGPVPGTAPGPGFIWILITICAAHPSPLIPLISSRRFPQLSSTPSSGPDNIPTFQCPKTLLSVPEQPLDPLRDCPLHCPRT